MQVSQLLKEAGSQPAQRRLLLSIPESQYNSGSVGLAAGRPQFKSWFPVDLWASHLRVSTSISSLIARVLLKRALSPHLQSANNMPPSKTAGGPNHRRDCTEHAARPWPLNTGFLLVVVVHDVIPTLSRLRQWDFWELQVGLGYKVSQG